MRVYVFDVIRIVAISMLLIAHIGQTIGNPVGGFFGIPKFYYVSIGGVAVSIFLILSGMTIEWNYKERSLHYMQYIVGRILRIYPTLYLSLLIGIGVYVAKAFSGYTLKPIDPIGEIIGSITGFSAFLGKWGGSFVGPSWFIGLIMSLYFVYPFLCNLIGTYPTISILAMLLFSILARLICGHFNVLPYRPLDWFPPCRVFEFCLGIWIVKSVHREAFARFNKYFNHTVGKVVSVVSDLAFPIFLVHSPFLIVITLMNSRGMRMGLSIVVYLLLVIGIAYCTHKIVDELFPRKVILKRLFLNNMQVSTSSN